MLHHMVGALGFPLFQSAEGGAPPSLPALMQGDLSYPRGLGKGHASPLRIAGGVSRARV